MIELSKKDILMYYHTSMRNVGLYTSVSVAMLGYSRFYRDKIKLYNISFILISLTFLLFSLLINYHVLKMVNEMNEYLKDRESNIDITHLFTLPYIIFFANILVFIFGLWTLKREL